VLVGPRAISAGDLFPVYMTHHPRARRFGRITDGSFGSITAPWIPDPYLDDLYMAYTYAACVDPELEWLQGAEVTPETEVWLEPDDGADGRDTVVEAALDWIAAGGDH
jgi:C-terminal processing protease CtpA/Prc